MQQEACASTEDELFLGGAKGPGKSDVVIFKPVKWTHHPRFKALILRKSFPELQELIDRTHRVFSRLTTAKRPAWNGELKRWTWPSGALYTFGYADSVKDLDRYHGSEPAYVGYDELGDVKDPAIWENLLLEIRSPDPNIPTQAVGSGNPGRAGHAWTKRRFIDKCGKHGGVYREAVKNPFTGTTFTVTRKFIPGRVWENPIYRDDARYMGRLLTAPEVIRRQLLFGDYDAGLGAALDELDWTKHSWQPFEPPPHWTMFGSFDWGYAHPWVFGWYAVNEDGVVYKCNTIRGRYMKDWAIIERIKRLAPLHRLEYIVAGHDCWAKHKARADDNTPSTEERFTESGITLTKANIARSAGLKNLREYHAWRGQGPKGEEGEPSLFWMRTKGNQRAFQALEAMVVDPDDMEDALKVNADPLTGEGGDDDYDETRYALASRPERPRSTWGDHEEFDAFSKEARETEMQRQRRSKRPKSGRGPLPDAVT